MEEDTKKGKKKRKENKAQQKCKSPMQRQRFMTIKNLTEKKKRKEKLRSLIGFFFFANKVDNQNREGKMEKKK